MLGTSDLLGNLPRRDDGMDDGCSRDVTADRNCSMPRRVVDVHVEVPSRPPEEAPASSGGKAQRSAKRERKGRRFSPLKVVKKKSIPDAVPPGPPHRAADPRLRRRSVLRGPAPGPHGMARLGPVAGATCLRPVGLSLSRTVAHARLPAGGYAARFRRFHAPS